MEKKIKIILSVSQKIFRNFSRFLCTVLCILILASGCTDGPKINTSLQLESLSGISVPAEHLVFIGLDGWGSAYVPKANMPTVKQMIAGGASSMDMRCIMPCISWPNWSTLFSGTLPEQRNGDITNQPATVMDFPSIFSLVNNNKTPKKSGSVFFYEWNTLDKICPDEKSEKIRISSNPESARKIAAYIIEKKPVFTAVVFNEPDHTGHDKHWGSTAYYAKLTELDNLIAIIEQAVKDAGVYDSTVFILSADHGGILAGHGKNFKKTRQIPIVIFGRGIKTCYTIPSPLLISDIAPTMAAIMGLEIPSTWTGRPLKEVFK